FARHSADLDGDGRLDLVTRTSGGYRVQFQRGDGDQLSFEPGSLIIVDGDSNLLGIDDFDGDGHFDLAFLTSVPSFAVELHLQQAQGTFAEFPDLVFPVQSELASKVQVADLNADGRPDLLMTGLGFTLEVFLGEDGSILPSTPSTSYSI